MLLHDPKSRFSDRVEDYVQHRPSYPKEVLNILAEQVRLPAPWNVADIGSGTGIFTRLLLDAAHRVAAVEPNEAMRQAAERELGGRSGFRSVDGNAEKTGLPDASVDLITAAQAFHWFDVEPTRAEWKRILRPEGIVALVWNTRTMTTDFSRAYEAFLNRHGTDYHEVGQRHRCSEARFAALFTPNQYRHHAMPNHQPLSLEGLKGRLLSSSYIPKGPGPAYDAMLADAERLFAEHQRDGSVVLEYTTDVYTGRLD
jgi:SAM-dependent methyltransferase